MKYLFSLVVVSIFVLNSDVSSEVKFVCLISFTIGWLCRSIFNLFDKYLFKDG